MGKLVHRHNEFIVIEDDYNNGHIIINTKGKYENHGHVKYLNTCTKLLKLMNKGIVPHSDYLRGTVLRISLDDKYIEKVKQKISKDKQKPKYININKGVRTWTNVKLAITIKRVLNMVDMAAC